MAGDLYLLPRGEAGIDFSLGGGDFALDAEDFGGEVEFVFLGLLAQLIELGAEFAQGFFKFERVDRLFHRGQSRKHRRRVNWCAYWGQCAG